MLTRLHVRNPWRELFQAFLSFPASINIHSFPLPPPMRRTRVFNTNGDLISGQRRADNPALPNVAAALLPPPPPPAVESLSGTAEDVRQSAGGNKSLKARQKAAQAAAAAAIAAAAALEDEEEMEVEDGIEDDEDEPTPPKRFLPPASVTSSSPPVKRQKQVQPSSRATKAARAIADGSARLQQLMQSLPEDSDDDFQVPTTSRYVPHRI